MTETMSVELALLCALDKVENQVRSCGPPDDEVEWSLTYGRHSIYATAHAEQDGECCRVTVNAVAGFLPWRRRESHRSITLS